MCELLLQLDGASVLRLFSLQPLKLWQFINICLLYVLVIYTYWGLFAAIVLLSTTSTSIYYVSLLITTKLYLSHKFRINFFVIFCNTIFAADNYIYDLSKYLITKTNQTLKERALSGVGKLLQGRSRLWFKLYVFSDS